MMNQHLDGWLLADDPQMEVSRWFANIELKRRHRADIDVGDVGTARRAVRLGEQSESRIRNRSRGIDFRVLAKRR